MKNLCINLYFSTISCFFFNSLIAQLHFSISVSCRYFLYNLFYRLSKLLYKQFTLLSSVNATIATAPGCSTISFDTLYFYFYSINFQTYYFPVYILSLLMALFSSSKPPLDNKLLVASKIFILIKIPILLTFSPKYSDLL